MRCRLVLLMLLLLAAGCSKPGGRQTLETIGSSDYPVLATGPNRQTAITNVSPVFKFKAAPGIRLDLREFRAVNDPSTNAPDMVQIVTPSGIYELLQPIVTNNYVLDRNTLKPLRGPAFASFRSGEEGSLHLGHTIPDKPGAFHVWWVARFSAD